MNPEEAAQAAAKLYKSKGRECLNGANGQLVVMSAHRYALGRMTYIVGAVVDWLLENRNAFVQGTVHTMMRDTIDALDGHNAGHDCDVSDWTRFAETLWSEMDDNDREWLRQAVRNKNGWIASR